MPLQEGIYYQHGQRPGRCFAILFLRAQSGITASAMDQCLSGLAAVHAELRAGRIGDLPGVSLPSSSLTILMGYGPKAFAITGVRRATPYDLGPRHQFRSPRAAGGGSVLIGSGLTYAEGLSRNPATEEIVVQGIADTPLAANRVIVETFKYLEDHPDPVTSVAPLQLACAFTGFNREDGRSWIDFHDGVSNLASGEERFGAIAVKPQGIAEDQWTESGTYLAFLRLGVDLTAWRKLSRTQQELLVGRAKLTGCPIAGVGADGAPVPQAGCPFTGTGSVFEPGNEGFREPANSGVQAVLDSHVQRANHHIGPIDRDVSARFYRQGYEFLEPPQPGRALLAGLNFVSFQDTLRRLFFVLTTPGWLGSMNFGGPPGEHLADSLLSVYAAGVFLCPPVVAGEQYPGQSIFVASSPT